MLKATWVSVVLSLYGYSFHYVHNEKRLSQDTQRIIMATCNLIQAVQILDDRYKWQANNSWAHTCRRIINVTRRGVLYYICKGFAEKSWAYCWSENEYDYVFSINLKLVCQGSVTVDSQFFKSSLDFFRPSAYA